MISFNNLPIRFQHDSILCVPIEYILHYVCTSLIVIQLLNRKVIIRNHIGYILYLRGLKSGLLLVYTIEVSKGGQVSRFVCRISFYSRMDFAKSRTIYSAEPLIVGVCGDQPEKVIDLSARVYTGLENPNVSLVFVQFTIFHLYAYV